MDLIVFLVSLIISYIACPMILDMLENSKATKLNYRNESIPIAMGLLFVFVQFINLGLVLFVRKNFAPYIILYLFSITLMGIIGLLDDFIGDESVKGFKGHIKSFFKGKLTTGAMKAGTGFLISLFVSIIISRDLTEIIINTFLISLFTNSINLFDLRPGRAIKVFILFSVIMLFTKEINEYNFILFSFYGILFIYLPIDLKALAMMGDIGSNVLGMTLGMYCVLTHNIIIKSIYLFVLFLIHIMAEKISFSKVIENNKILNFLDQLGR
ncbi:MAG: phospho-N-acetylmuramoyl-pentapeptide-transferase [Tissierellia bacterium]|nr:phospho-N-acetylmuramoyl-pentapeptide-transferase [Tissierellia bacterium]